MLSLAKLAGSNQRYFLDQAQRRVDHTESVSSGAEDYYLTGPEAVGEWSGSAAGRLGLRGDVSEQALRAVLTRHDPRSGLPLEGSVQRARVPGFDLMFSVPKSASILFGIGSASIQKAVLDAQRAAVAAALGYLERHACRTRRGAGGFEIVPGGGFVGAAFKHRASRAGDPQVHTHVLIANATRVSDGSWRSLDGRAIYAEARTAGFVHEAVFRRELSARLGVCWGPVRNGIAEIEGVPPGAIRAFSRRKAEIDAQVEAWGVDTAAARQIAAVQTRRGKDYSVTPEQLAPEWRSRAATLGLDHRRLAAITHHTRHTAHPDHEAIAQQLLASTGLTAQRSSFDRRDVVRAFSEAAGAGSTLSEIDRFTDWFLTSAEVVPLTEPGGGMRREDMIRLRDGRVISAVAASPRYSTVELLAVEQRVLGTARAARESDAGRARPDAVDAALKARSTIGADQAAMVRRLLASGAGIDVVVGPPGTGKTFALAAAREAWSASGFRVLGAAVARRAAMELSAAAGIEATSIAALLVDLRQGPADLLDDRTVLVVDEAAMLGTRDLDELAQRTTRAGAKLVLVGDHAQLPEIEAGGAFAALAARSDAIRLKSNRRQVREIDRRMLELWRDGRLTDALTIAIDSGDLVLAASPEAAHGELVRDYVAAVLGGEDAIMLAPRRAEVRHLNAIARAELMRAGRVLPDGIEIGGRTFAVGDHVLLRRNDLGLDVQNGQRGVIAGVDTATGALTFVVADGARRVLPSRYVHSSTRAGTPAIEHGYALTAHLAQGMTVDRAFVLGSETVYREWGYVAWSRARKGTRFYAVDAQLDDEHHTAADPPADRFSETVRRLERSEAQAVASKTAPPAAIAARHARIGYLETALGPRPERLRQRRRWDRAARRIERFRQAHGVAGASLALGPEPTGLAARVEWRKAQREIESARRGHERSADGRSRSLRL